MHNNNVSVKIIVNIIANSNEIGDYNNNNCSSQVLLKPTTQPYLQYIEMYSNDIHTL